MQRGQQQQRKPAPNSTQPGGWKRWSQPEWDAWRKEKAAKDEAAAPKAKEEEQNTGNSPEDQAKTKT